MEAETRESDADECGADYDRVTSKINVYDDVDDSFEVVRCVTETATGKYYHVEQIVFLCLPCRCATRHL